MSFRDQVTRVHTRKSYFILLYGSPGIGKTTFATRAPKPIFIDLEDSLSALGVHVDSLPIPKDYAELLSMVDDLIQDPEYPNKTLVIDSLTRMEAMIEQEILKEHKKKSLTGWGWGEGYKMISEKSQILFDKLKELREKKGWNIILTAHPVEKEVSSALHVNTFERIRPNISKGTEKLWTGSVDAVLYAAKDTHILYDEKTGKGTAVSDDSRILYTEYQDNLVAKNRFGLPIKIPFEWAAFDAAAKEGNPNSPQAIINRMNGLLNTVENEELKQKVVLSIDKANNDPARLAALEEKLNKSLGEK